jgi:hypothetical protein
MTKAAKNMLAAACGLAAGLGYAWGKGGLTYAVSVAALTIGIVGTFALIIWIDQRYNS